MSRDYGLSGEIRTMARLGDCMNLPSVTRFSGLMSARSITNSCATNGDNNIALIGRITGPSQSP